MGTDVLLDPHKYADPQSVLLLVLPYSPLLALTLGPVPGAVAWFLAAAITLSAQGESQTIMALLFPLLPVAVFATYLLRWRSAIILSMALFAMVPVIGMRHHATGAYIVGLFLAAAVTAGLSLNVMRRRNERGARELAEARRRESLVRAEERRHLAHELHDIVAHDVTIIAMQANRAGLSTDAAKTAELLSTISRSARQTLHDLRNLVVVLNDVTPDNLLSAEDATAMALDREIAGIVDALRTAHYAVDLHRTGPLEAVPSRLIPPLRRTVREIGTNILKHGDTSEPVSIRISVDDQQLSLEATNSVSTPKSMPSSLTGLEAMKERTQLLGGSIEFGPDEGRWRTALLFPLIPTPEKAPAT